MKKLLKEERFWELYWGFERSNNGANILKSDLEKKSSSFGKKILGYMRHDYHDYILWNVIYEKYMPKIEGAKILEIGSAPGNHLARIAKTFGFVPYGVENSKYGVELNRKVFDLYNINTDNVIYADFFSDEFQLKYKGFFDVIISRGFIEDFSGANVENIIEKHVNLLTKGGHLFVSIPNLRGIYYFWVRLFDRPLLSELNFDIMQKDKFLKLFDGKNLSILFCDYYGIFNCGNRFTARRDLSIRFIIVFLGNLQKILNLIFHLTLKNKNAETGIFSPYLQFIGKKN